SSPTCSFRWTTTGAPWPARSPPSRRRRGKSAWTRSAFPASAPIASGRAWRARVSRWTGASTRRCADSPRAGAAADTVRGRVGRRASGGAGGGDTLGVAAERPRVERERGEEHRGRPDQTEPHRVQRGHETECGPAGDLAERLGLAERRE